jgi:uncharacterized protein YndB with AHSA1/START domain
MTKSYEPVHKEIVVEASQERAFKFFTEEFDTWWPREHKIGKAPLKRAVFETKLHGRWFEIDEDGSECNWGKVLQWDPYNGFVMAWQINGQWQFDPSLITEVEVRFAAEGPNRTRISLEHRNIDRFGASAEQIKKAFESEMGWQGLLERFASAVKVSPVLR